MRTTKGFILVCLALTMSAASMLAVSCGISKADLTEQVRASIEEQWEEQGYDIKIKDLSLVKQSKTEYLGILKVEGYGESDILSVLVRTDDDTIIWEIVE